MGFWADQGDAMVALPDSCTTEVTGVKTFSSDPACPAYVCASWCNAWTTGMDACASCPVKNYLAAGAYCSPWCNVYTCGMGMCHGCQMCQDYLNSKYCAPWCNAYTLGGCLRGLRGVRVSKQPRQRQNMGSIAVA